ncbi:hypothetical protein [Mycoplasma leonicaptivi]|uniref:hypothetical protein n=1 Tax=Mycoplasma leonicaptivi TaxID=36742 RepID=UPI00048944E3|nr:hypothetical protein [Mycoplasma leonicaptivi]
MIKIPKYKKLFLSFFSLQLFIAPIITTSCIFDSNDKKFQKLLDQEKKHFVEIKQENNPNLKFFIPVYKNFIDNFEKTYNELFNTSLQFDLKEGHVLDLFGKFEQRVQEINFIENEFRKIKNINDPEKGIKSNHAMAYYIIIDAQGGVEFVAAGEFTRAISRLNINKLKYQAKLYELMLEEFDKLNDANENFRVLFNIKNHFKDFYHLDNNNNINEFTLLHNHLVDFSNNLDKWKESLNKEAQEKVQNIEAKYMKNNIGLIFSLLSETISNYGLILKKVNETYYETLKFVPILNDEKYNSLKLQIDYIYLVSENLWRTNFNDEFLQNLKKIVLQPNYELFSSDFTNYIQTNFIDNHKNNYHLNDFHNYLKEIKKYIKNNDITKDIDLIIDNYVMKNKS